MKAFVFLPIVLLSASSLFAQSPEPAPASELSRLRQGYVDSLNRLLQQFVKNEDVAAAVTVSQELDRMADATVDTAPNLSSCGTWVWPGGDVIIIAANGITTHPNWKTRGIWRWTDESRHQFQIKWQDGFIDKAAVSPDGTILQLVNNNGDKFLARRVPAPEKTVVSDAMK